MVQRKVPAKLGLQAEHAIKSEKRLANLKPSIGQHQDGKNRGPDLRRKIKKSRSIQLSDIESLKSSPLMKKTIPQPGKPPPTLRVAASAATTPQKQSVIKATDGPPNYMKSTTSSQARKESSQVSSRIARTSPVKNNLRHRSLGSSKSGSSSGNKPGRLLTKTSSLKVVRTLTKTPSFKPARTSAKKCSRVALCADMNAQRATCSSTLKDSKFPSYLMLNPGGTEAVGTSIMKVCPYTYCSLNGHHHTPLPPLKSFLAARRRLMKTQKNFKLGALSPRKAKPSSNRKIEIDTGQLLFNEEPAYEEVDLGTLPMSPSVQEEGIDYFIEIYAKSKEYETQECARSIAKDEERISDFVEEVEVNNKLLVGGWDEAASKHDDEEQVAESLSEESPKSEIAFEENIDQCRDVSFSEEHRVDDAGEDYSFALGQPAPEGFDHGIDFEGEDVLSIELDDTNSGAVDMEWEEGQSFASEPDDKEDCSRKNCDEFDLGDGIFSESELTDLYDEAVSELDDHTNGCMKMTLADEIQQEVQEKESDGFEEQFDNRDSEMDVTNQNQQMLESSKESDSFHYDQPYSAEEDFGDSTAVEEEGEEAVIISTTTEANKEVAENEIPEVDPRSGDAETNCVADRINKASNDHQEAQNDYAAEGLQNQTSDISGISRETNPDEANERDQTGQMLDALETDQHVTCDELDIEQKLPGSEVGHENQTVKVIDGIQSDNVYEDEDLSEDIIDENLPAEIGKNQSLLEKDKDKAKAFKLATAMSSEEQSEPNICKISSAENCIEEVSKMEVEDKKNSGAAETFLMTNTTAKQKSESSSLHTKRNPNQELTNICSNPKWTIGCNKPTGESEDERMFNPREPNFLPVAPEPDAEKVDLRHQMVDERKNSEEWMIDYALQRAVTKLAPARKRKVALLVEAFETVIPVPKWETRLRHASAAFTHTRPIQACS